MNDTFIYIDSEVKTIQQKKFICIYVLDLDKKIILKIYKSYNDELKNFLEGLHYYDSINSYLSFAIKRDGKIALDIKI